MKKAKKRVISETEKKNITVKITIPENVSDTVRQQKINRLYDILKDKKNSA